MKLWFDNQKGFSYVLADEDVAAKFMASPWEDYPWPLERALSAFLGAKADDGGLQSSWVTSQILPGDPDAEAGDKSWAHVLDLIAELRSASPSTG